MISCHTNFPVYVSGLYVFPKHLGCLTFVITKGLSLIVPVVFDASVTVIVFDASATVIVFDASATVIVFDASATVIVFDASATVIRSFDFFVPLTRLVVNV